MGSLSKYSLYNAKNAGTKGRIGTTTKHAAPRSPQIRELSGDPTTHKKIRLAALFHLAESPMWSFTCQCVWRRQEPTHVIVLLEIAADYMNRQRPIDTRKFCRRQKGSVRWPGCRERGTSDAVVAGRRADRSRGGQVKGGR